MVHDAGVSCPCVLFNGGDAKGTDSSKILCPIFVYVLFYVNLCYD